MHLDSWESTQVARAALDFVSSNSYAIIRNNYFLKLEDELNSLCMWAESQKQTVILMGDLNLNRLDINKREGKILMDLEESFDLECLINRPTKITDHSSNKPDMFNKSGTYNPEISDHCLIYGLLNEKIMHYKPKIMNSRKSTETWPLRNAEKPSKIIGERKLTS